MGVFRRFGKKGPTWYIDFYIAGKRHVEAVGPNKSEAQELLGDKLKQIRRRKLGDAPPVPFEDLADDYEKTVKGAKGYVVGKYYIKLVRGHFAGRLVSEITALDVERFKTQRKETPLRGENRPPRTGAAVNRELACLRAMLSRAVEWELIEKNPASRVKDFPEPPGRNAFLSTEEAGRLLEVCHPHLRPIVLCALETGMRKSEILGLRWREVRNGMIYLAADRTKNGKPREIPISDLLAAEFKRLKAARGAGVVPMTELVFRVPGAWKAPARATIRPLPARPMDIRKDWETAKKKAGIPAGFHFHDLRHTFASHQKMAGVDDYTLMELMGHSDFSMMKRYAHLAPEHKRQAIARLPEWKAKKDSDKSATKEKGPQTGNLQPLDLAGAEEGS